MLEMLIPANVTTLNSLVPQQYITHSYKWRNINLAHGVCLSCIELKDYTIRDIVVQKKNINCVVL